MALRDRFVSDGNYKFDIRNIKNWEDFVEELPVVSLKDRIKEYANVSVKISFKPKNMVQIFLSAERRTGEVDEFIYLFNELGCKEQGYDSAVSKCWRNIIMVPNFGEEYVNYFNKKAQSCKEL